MSSSDLVVDIDDIKFCLFEWLQVDQLQKYLKYEDFDADTLALLLQEGTKRGWLLQAWDSVSPARRIKMLLRTRKSGCRALISRIEVKTQMPHQSKLSSILTCATC